MAKQHDHLDPEHEPRRSRSALPPGAAPGTVHIHEPATPLSIDIISYNKQDVFSTSVATPAEIPSAPPSKG